ncbi:MAG: hypothetical protein HDQ96_01145 [Lachnospiraceae bacterium]|nr:hypothetical protein [Lachnospiraceae bacterium]
MVYFRIEDIANYEGIQRNYRIETDKLPVMNKQAVEYYIAEEIRKEVNGSKDRNLLSYSKSLGVCLIKYNEYVDNELHICYVNDMWYENSICYFSPNQHIKHKIYSLEKGLYSHGIFKGNDEIKLINFVLDIANNKLLNDYLLKFTKTGLKQYASPEKDYEVIMMQAYDDLTIEIYIDSIYLLYALQLKYNFLRNRDIVNLLICEISQLEDFRFENCEHERQAIIFLIQYLYSETEFEKIVFEEMLKYSEKREIFYGYYNSLLQLHGIIYDDFEDSYHLSDYNDNVVSDIFWKYCMIYGKNLRQHKRRDEY